jgi:hypothetical protein
MNMIIVQFFHRVSVNRPLGDSQQGAQFDER